MSIQRIGFFVVVLLTVIAAAQADTVVIQEVTAAQFAIDFGPTTGSFNGITTPGNFVLEGGSFSNNGVMYDDGGAGGLIVSSELGFDIGTEPDAVLTEGGSGNGINMTFGAPVVAVGLIAGDPEAVGGGVATFDATFGDGSSVSDVGGDGSLPIIGGDNPNYFVVFDVGGNGITNLSFSTNTQFPTIDTLTTTITSQGLATIPEPNSVWLIAILMLALGVGSIIRKRKAVVARMASSAAPLALLAVFAALAVPSRSFAQVNCNIAVPNNPLTAAGLATPYILSAGDAGCSEAAGTMAFVQAAIYDPAAHTISVYTPLVINPASGSPLPKPTYAIAPVVPKLPPNAVVAIWFGYNANNLTLTGSAVTNGTCFTLFGQFAACNTTNFWNAVNADTTLLTSIWNMAKSNKGGDNLACPTSRSFSIVDQDPER